MGNILCSEIIRSEPYKFVIIIGQKTNSILVGDQGNSLLVGIKVGFNLG